MQSRHPDLNSGWTTVELAMQPRAGPNATQLALGGCSLTDCWSAASNFLDKCFGNVPNASAIDQYIEDPKNRWDKRNRENLNCVHGSVLSTLRANPSELPQSVRAQQQRRRLDVTGDGLLSCSEPGASFPVPNSPMSPARMMIIGLLLHVFSHGERNFSL